MQLYISTNDGIPIYRQIVQQVKLLVASQRLKPGDEMPAIRQLAEQLLINPNTVARAYRELEGAGLLESKQGSGTRVAGDGSPLNDMEKTKLLSARVDALLAEAGSLGVGIEELTALLQARHAAMRADR